MTKLKLLMLILASCTVMFISWITLGSYFLSESRHGIAVVCFIFAFISALGQFATLAFTLQERSYIQQMKSAQNKSIKQKTQNN